MRQLRPERIHATRPLINRLTRRLLAFGGALTVAAGLITIQAPQALAADSTTYLNGATVGGDVAAGAGKVFVAANDRIILANARGELTGAITGLSGVVGLAMTPDGTTSGTPPL